MLLYFVGGIPGLNNTVRLYASIFQSFFQFFRVVVLEPFAFNDSSFPGNGILLILTGKIIFPLGISYVLKFS